MGSYFPNQGMNLCPLQSRLTESYATGLPQKFPDENS